MKFEEYEYQIGEHFLSALIDADATGLSDEEEAELDDWEHSVREEHGAEGSFIVQDDDTDYGTCDITGMGSDVCRVVYMVQS